MKTKNLVFFIVLSLLVSFSFAQVQATTASPEHQAFVQVIRQQIQDVKAKIIQLQQQLEEMKAESETGESKTGKLEKKTISVTVSDPMMEVRGEYDIAAIDDYDFTNEISAPVLPVKSFSLVIPREAKIRNIKVTSSEKEVLRGEFNIYPAQQPVPLSMSKDDLPAFSSPNPSIYKSSNAYPGKLFKYTGDGYLRDYRILSLNVYPLQYNPSGKKLTFYKNINIEVNYTVPSSESDKKIGEQDEFTEMVKSMVDNPEDVEELTIAVTEAASEVLSLDDAEYIIITKKFLQSEFQVLLDWKIQKGLTGKIVTVSWIKDNYTGTDTQEQIRNFLKDAETTWNTKWVLLGGDTNVIPHRLIWSQWNPMIYGDGYYFRVPADIYYSGLDSNTPGASADLYPDVFVGRAPVDTTSETQTFVNKVITYEKGPVGYETTALFFADGAGAELAKKLIKRKSLPKHFSLTQLYQCSTNSAMQELNLGYGIVNHAGHAWEEGLCLSSGCHQYYRIRTTHVNTLTNSSRNPIVYSAGCLSNAIDKNHTIAKSFILNRNGGAVAYMGSSRYGIAIPSDPGNGPSDRYDKSFFNSLFNKGIDNLGQTFADSKAALAPSCTHPADCSYRYLQYGLNLLGDPEMKIWTSKTSVPSKFSVTATSPVKVNENTSFVVNAEILYYGEQTVTSVEAVLTLPTGLSMSETLTKPIRDMLPGHMAKVSWNITASNTGTYDITITATAANAPSASNTTAVQVMTPDSTPPTITLQSPTDNAPAGDDANVVFEYTPTDAQGISKCELMINGSVLSTDYEIEEGITNEFSELMTTGTHTWEVNCIDDAPDANIGASEQRSLTVEDRTSPTDGLITITDTDGYTNNPLPDLQISANGADYMAFSCDNSGFTTWIKYAESFSSFNMETGAGCSTGDGEKTIYVKFKDEAGNEGALASDTIIFDTILPTIGGVEISDIASMTATITWTTNELANTVVNYGLSTPLTSSKSNASLVAGHSITLTGLSPSTTYYYEVESSDIAGNIAVDNNGGSYYTFTTLSPGYMHIKSIDMSAIKAKCSWRVDEPCCWKGWATYAKAKVTIVDASNNPVEAATVSGSWTGLTNDTDSGKTNSSGQATLISNFLKNPNGTFTFTVDNVTKNGWIYNSSANEGISDSITVGR